MIDAAVPLKEKDITDEASEDCYVGLTLEGGAHLASVESNNSAPFTDKNILDASLGKTESVPLLNFIPYYSRSSRGGKGQMRVGLRHKRLTLADGVSCETMKQIQDGNVAATSACVPRYEASTEIVFNEAKSGYP
nr:hypothetical protein CFP56_03062 [Quercus suber]